MRLSVAGVEFTLPNKLLEALENGKIKDDEIIQAINTLVIKCDKPGDNGAIAKMKNVSKARLIRQSKTKEKVINAINLLKLQGEEVNPYRIAKLANISYNTARKYFKELKVNQRL